MSKGKEVANRFRHPAMEIFLFAISYPALSTQHPALFVG